jgi:hypothetical protein
MAAIGIAAVGAAAAAGVFDDPKTLAANPVGCYDGPSLARNVTVLSPGTATPIQACRRALATAGPLVACAEPGVMVYVFPGGAGTCEKLGLEPLPRDYSAARRHVNAFAAAVTTLERRTDCLAPRELARRVDALLQRSGWTGWHAWLRLDIEDGPCGAVSAPSGNGRLAIDGAFDTRGRRVIVVGTAARSTRELVYGPRGLFARLDATTKRRCLTGAKIGPLVRRRTDRALRLDGVASGCARIGDVRPAADGYGIVVVLRG